MQELRCGKRYKPKPRNEGADGNDPPAGFVLVRVQCALLAREKSMAEEPGAKKNDANNEGSDCHGELIYSLSRTVGK
jgi:hypothetical protein